jgi:hypothetical protein
MRRIIQERRSLPNRSYSRGYGAVPVKSRALPTPIANRPDQSGIGDRLEVGPADQLDKRPVGVDRVRPAA